MGQDSSRMVTVSVIVPVYSGHSYLTELAKRLDQVRQDWDRRLSNRLQLAEAIFVDDGSTDGSAEVLTQLSERHSWLSVLSLSRNFGQHAATMAGILHSSGDWVVTMDEDLQHPPEHIVELLAKAVSTSSDTVYGRPVSGSHDSRFRDSSSRLYKSVLAKLSGNAHLKQISSFRLLRGSIARAASSVCSHDTYFDVALSWFSTRVQSVPLELQDIRYQQEGKSGYRLGSLLSHARRMLVTSHLKVLRLGALFGFMVIGLSALVSAALIAVKLLSPALVQLPGWTSLMLTNMFFGGLSLIMFGMILEYLSLLVMRAHGRPIYFVIDRHQDAELAECLRDQQC